MGTGVAVRAAQHPSVEDAEGSSLFGRGGRPTGGVAPARLVFTSSPRVLARYFFPGLNRVKGLSEAVQSLDTVLGSLLG